MKHMSGYTIAMRDGHRWLRLDGYVRARGYFTQALEKANDDAERATALHMRGITQQQLGRFGTAHQDFEDALRHTPTDSILTGRILRDKGLCYLDQARGNFSLEKKAYTLLDASHVLLQKVHTYEASLTLSCLGEYYRFIGDHYERLRVLRQAVRELYGWDAAYEMNCRLRLAKASKLWRWVGAPRALIVCVQTADGTVDLVEYVLLLIGGGRLAGAGRRRLVEIQLVLTRR